MSGSAPDPPPASQSSLSQPASQSSHSQPAKEDCTVGKKDPMKDVYMTFDLIFKFDDDPTLKVVGKLTPHQKQIYVLQGIAR